MKFKNIFNLADLKFEDWSMGDNYSGTSAEITKNLNNAKLDFHVETLAPKKYSCPYHYHTNEEELFIFLEGEVTLRQNGEFRKVGKGDIVFCELGKDFVHQFYNHTDQDCKFIAISNTDKSDIAIYPDSDKVNIRSERKLFQLKNAVPYLTDEEDPSKFWETNN